MGTGRSLSIALLVLAMAAANPSATRLSSESTSGRMDEAPTERIKEYWFYVPLLVDGARVRKGNQEAGVRIAVNRDGRLASLRVAGPTSRTASQPLPRLVSDQSIEAQLARDFPNSETRSFGLNYVLDLGDPKIGL
jgi:hypothetical protein